MNKKLLTKIHLWLSLPLGIFVIIICLSGATLVFKHEIRSALGMPTVVAPHGHQQRTGHDWAASFSSKKPNHGIMNTADKQILPHGTTTQRDFFSYVTRFHTSLMLGTVGKRLITLVTLLFVVVLVSGMLVCWPRSHAQWLRCFKVECHRGKRRLFYDLHVSLGFIVVLWLLLLSVTGLAFGFHLLPKGSAAIQVFHALHVGKWGGLFTKIITFIVCLIGASLPVTGYYLYWKKHFPHR